MPYSTTPRLSIRHAFPFHKKLIVLKGFVCYLFSSQVTTMSAPKQIIMPKNVEVAQLSYGTPKKLDSGGRLVPIFYQNSPLVIQTPAMRTPYGLNAWTQEKADGDQIIKYSLNLTLDTKNDTSGIHEMLQMMDNKLIDDVCANSLSWLNKKSITPDIAKALYTPMIKLAKDKNTGDVTDAYPPTFKVNLPHSDGKFACTIYDADRNPIELDTIPKRSLITAICQCTGIWVAGGKFGCNWKVVQLRYVPPPTTVPKTYAFLADGEDE